MEDLACKIQRLEDIESIKQLKSRYFHGCDRKFIDTIRSCFAEGNVVIDYGAIGSFNNREDFLKVYQEKACHPHIIDMHHGQNPQISWVSPAEATATWDLFFYQIDKSTSITTQLAGFYLDKFTKVEGEWKISETRFQVTSSVVSSFQDEHLKLLFAGAAP